MTSHSLISTTTVPLLDKYLPRILLIVAVVSLPTAYFLYLHGEVSYLSPEWLVQELSIALLVPIGAHFVITYLGLPSTPCGVIRSFLFYSGLWMVYSLARGGVFSYIDPPTKTVTLITLLATISCLYHYFYTPYLLLIHPIDKALTRSKELVASAPFRPFRYMLTATLISYCLRFSIRLVDPMLETAMGITLLCIATNVATILTALLAGVEALNTNGATLPHQTNPTTQKVLEAILAPRGIIILLAVFLLLSQFTGGQVRRKVPSATFTIESAQVFDDRIAVQLTAIDPTHELRGLEPMMFYLAGEQLSLFKEIGLVADIIPQPPAYKVDTRIHPTKKATFVLIFRKSLFAPELWRTPEEFRKLTDLTLWYGENKIGRVAIK